MRWYYNETPPVRTGLNFEDGTTLYKDISLEQLREIERVLDEPFSEYGHKCLVIYRDAVTGFDDRYDFCLSCGDVRINGQHFYLTSSQVDKLKDIKDNIMRNV